NVFDVSGAHTYADEGTYAVAVQINDIGRASASVGTSATVADAPLAAQGATLAPVEGAPFSGIVATFTDANPSAALADFSATISWGDGNTSSGVITFDAATGVCTVSAANTYAEEGSYPVSVQINDDGGSNAFVSETATVADAPLTAHGATIATAEGAPV